MKTIADQEELRDNHVLALGGKCVSTYRAVSVGVMFFIMNLKKTTLSFLSVSLKQKQEQSVSI